MQQAFYIAAGLVGFGYLLLVVMLVRLVIATRRLERINDHLLTVNLHLATPTPTPASGPYDSASRGVALHLRWPSRD